MWKYCNFHGWVGVPEHLPPNRDFVVAPEDLPLREQALAQVVLETRPISCVPVKFMRRQPIRRTIVPLWSFREEMRQWPRL